MLAGEDGVEGGVGPGMVAAFHLAFVGDFLGEDAGEEGVWPPRRDFLPGMRWHQGVVESWRGWGWNINGRACVLHWLWIQKRCDLVDAGGVPKEENIS